MSDVQTIPVPPKQAATSSPREVAAILARALNDLGAAPRVIEATGRRASPQEGLALVESFLAIQAPDLRQAVLDAVAALAQPRT